MEQVEEVVTKFGTKAAMKLPPMMVQGLRGQVSQTSFLANLCEGLAPAGEESVTVPAGTFTALRYHSAKHESDTWVVPTSAVRRGQDQGEELRDEPGLEWGRGEIVDCGGAEGDGVSIEIGAWPRSCLK